MDSDAIARQLDWYDEVIEALGGEYVCALDENNPIVADCCRRLAAQVEEFKAAYLDSLRRDGD